MGPYIEEHIGRYIETPVFKNEKNADIRRNMILAKIKNFKQNILSQAKVHATSVAGPEGSAFSKKAYKELPDMFRDHADEVYAERVLKDERLQKLEAQGLKDYDLLNFIGTTAESMGAEGFSV